MRSAPVATCVSPARAGWQPGVAPSYRHHASPGGSVQAERPRMETAAGDESRVKLNTADSFK